jgi:adenosylcobinamide-GDP ribazoletransferase
MIMRPFTTRLILALGFLSRIPLPGKTFSANSDAKLAESADVLPIVGLIVALPAGLVFFVTSLIWQPVISAALALITLTIVTGALHDDGLADCADAFFGARDIERRLEIMKDSRIGTFGALALVFVFALGWACLTQIAETNGTYATLAALFIAASASRAGVVWHWHVLPSARPDGLAASQGKPDWNAVVLSAIYAAFIAVSLVIAVFGIGTMIIVLTFAFTAALGTMILARAKVGGHTGDTLGLSQKITELAVLLALASA